MPRLNRKSELFANITEVGVFRDAAGGGSSTATGTLPSIDTLGVLNVVSGTNFLANDWFRGRDPQNRPEINQVGSISVNAITPKLRHAFPYVVGDPVVEQTQVPLGHIGAEGVDVQVTGADTAVQSSVRRLELAYLLGNLKIEVMFSVLGINLENFMAAMGMLDTSANIGGSGVSATPYRAWVDATKTKEQNDLCWYINGTRKDGTTLIFHAWGAELDWTGLQTQFARGQAALIPFKLAPTSAIRFIEYL